MRKHDNLIRKNHMGGKTTKHKYKKTKGSKNKTKRKKINCH